MKNWGDKNREKKLCAQKWKSKQLSEGSRRHCEYCPIKKYKQTNNSFYVNNRIFVFKNYCPSCNHANEICHFIESIIEFFTDAFQFCVLRPMSKIILSDVLLSCVIIWFLSVGQLRYYCCSKRNHPHNAYILCIYIIWIWIINGFYHKCIASVEQRLHYSYDMEILFLHPACPFLMTDRHPWHEHHCCCKHIHNIHSCTSCCLLHKIQFDPQW